MRGLSALVRVQLLGAFGINRLIKGGSAKEKRRALLAAVGLAALAVLLELYVVGISIAMGALGFARAMIPAWMAICSLIALFFSIIKSNGALFGFRDYDTVMSMPVSVSAVVLSRLLAIYAMDLLTTAAVMLPGIVVLAAFEPVSTGALAMLLLSIPLIPLLPVAIAAVVGAAIAAIASRMRNANMVVVALSAAALLLVLGGSLAVPSDRQRIMQLMSGALSAMENIYPLSRLYARIVEGDLLSFVYFALLSIGPFAALVPLLSRAFGWLNSALLARRTRGEYKAGELKGKSPLWALTVKELRRLFSSAVYLLNTCFGLLLMVAAGVASLLMGAQGIAQAINLPGSTEYLGAAAPLILCFCAALSSTTCVSLNMEGKARWLALSLPVRAVDLFRAKIAANLVLALPFTLVSGALLSIGLSLTVAQAAMTILLPACLVVFAAVVGMELNRRFPRYDWTSQQQAVKQSMSMGVMIAIAFGVQLLIGGFSIALAGHALLVQTAACALLLLISALVYRGFARVKLFL